MTRDDLDRNTIIYGECGREVPDFEVYARRGAQQNGTAKVGKELVRRAVNQPNSKR